MLPGPAKKHPTKKTGFQKIGREKINESVLRTKCCLRQNVDQNTIESGAMIVTSISIRPWPISKGSLLFVCIISLCQYLTHYVTCAPEIALIIWLIFKSDGDSLFTISLLLIFYSSLLNRTQSVSCILKASCHEILPPTSVLSNKVVMKHINKLVSHGKPIFNIIDIHETRLHTIWWYFVKQRIKLNL